MDLLEQYISDCTVCFLGIVKKNQTVFIKEKKIEIGKCKTVHFIFLNDCVFKSVLFTKDYRKYVEIC